MHTFNNFMFNKLINKIIKHKKMENFVFIS